MMQTTAARFSDAVLRAVLAARAAQGMLSEEQRRHLRAHLRAILDAGDRRPLDDRNADGTVLVRPAALLALGEHARATVHIALEALRQYPATEELRGKIAELEGREGTLLLAMAEIASARPRGERGRR